MADLENTYWWCLVHNRVERWEDTDSPDRLGPFSSYDAAANALQMMADREAEYDREDSDDDRPAT